MIWQRSERGGGENSEDLVPGSDRSHPHREHPGIDLRRCPCICGMLLRAKNSIAVRTLNLIGRPWTARDGPKAPSSELQVPTFQKLQVSTCFNLASLTSRSGQAMGTCSHIVGTVATLPNDRNAPQSLCWARPRPETFKPRSHFHSCIAPRMFVLHRAEPHQSRAGGVVK